MTTSFFSPLSFVAVFGSGIRDPGSGIRDPGWVKSGSGIRNTGDQGPYSDRSDLRFEALFVKEIRRVIE